MSSSQGLGGGCGNTQLNSLVQENITVESDESDVQQVLEQYLQTPEGQAIQGDPAKLEALKGDLKAILAASNMGLNEAGDVVAVDSTDHTANPTAADTVSDPSAGKDAIDEVVDKAFKEVFGTEVYHADRLDTTRRAVEGNSMFAEAIAAMQNYMNNPGDARTQSNCMMKINALQANSGCQDIHSLMFLVMRQAIEEDNANKSYFVARIMEENKKSEALGDYLKELQESMVEISNKQKGQKSNDRPDVVSDGGVKRDTPPVVTYEDGQPTAKCEKISDSANPPPYTQKQIESEIKNVETAQETIRNERERFVTSFEDFENKVNQNYKLLVQFLKTYNENVKKPIQNLL